MWRLSLRVRVLADRSDRLAAAVQPFHLQQAIRALYGTTLIRIAIALLPWRRRRCPPSGSSKASRRKNSKTSGSRSEVKAICRPTWRLSGIKQDLPRWWMGWPPWG